MKEEKLVPAEEVKLNGHFNEFKADIFSLENDLESVSFNLKNLAREVKELKLTHQLDKPTRLLKATEFPLLASQDLEDFEWHKSRASFTFKLTISPYKFANNLEVSFKGVKKFNIVNGGAFKKWHVDPETKKVMFYQGEVKAAPKTWEVENTIEIEYIAEAGDIPVAEFTYTLHFVEKKDYGDVDRIIAMDPHPVRCYPDGFPKAYPEGEKKW